mmetsp:Transcript_13023/g.27083  ORF Transcript_13023/g.27083 Transcript_13023/m.27083 type:complete len:100 (+) Transcript_13023:870-1169(+)
MGVAGKAAGGQQAWNPPAGSGGHIGGGAIKCGGPGKGGRSGRHDFGIGGCGEFEAGAWLFANSACSCANSGRCQRYHTKRSKPAHWLLEVRLVFRIHRQ